MIGRQYGYLPRRYQHLNEHGIQTKILVAQGYVITVIALLYALIPAVANAYFIFMVMTTSVYLIMYILMFIAAVNLRRRYPDPIAWQLLALWFRDESLTQDLLAQSANTNREHT
jgi:glutamate:GABA antiporter